MNIRVVANPLAVSRRHGIYRAGLARFECQLIQKWNDSGLMRNGYGKSVDADGPGVFEEVLHAGRREFQVDEIELQRS